MNKRKTLVLVVLTIFLIGMCISSVDAASFTCKKDKTKYLGNDVIDVWVSHRADSEIGRGVSVVSHPKYASANRPSHYKLDKITIKYKVGSKTYTKTRKINYYNGCFVKLPKKFKIVKITVKYHKATKKQYSKLFKYCEWVY